MSDERRKLQLFDTVRIKDTELVGWISCFVEPDKYAVNYGYDDNQAVCASDELELLNSEED